MKTYKFDIAEHLQTDEDIKEFLVEVAGTGNDSDFIHAINIAARAKGMTQIAEKAGVTRASLYKSLSETGSPKFSTIYQVVSALGCKITIQ